MKNNKLNKGNTTHGLYYHPLYVTWVMMKQRCENPNAIGYKNYGGRGICVSKRWQNIKYFIEDMGERPSPKHTIDRIDVNGNYCKENCKWSNTKEQSKNKRNSKILEFNGKKLSISEWSKKTGISEDNIYNRLILGWSVEDVLTKKVRPQTRKIKYNGQELTIKEWSSFLGIKIRTINTRIYKNWPLDKVLTSKKYK